MINRDIIERAAAWIADQQRERDESEQWISLAVRVKRARDILAQQAAKGLYQIGMCVPCERQVIEIEGDPPMATVHVEPDRIYGYLPDDIRPSFIWPPDLAVKLCAKWESELALDQSASPPGN